MAVIKQLIDNDTSTQIYPITTTSAVLDNDSNTLLSLLDDKANVDDMFIVENANTLIKSILIKPEEYTDLTLLMILNVYRGQTGRLTITNTDDNSVTNAFVLSLLNNPAFFVILKLTYNYSTYFLTKSGGFEEGSDYIFSGCKYDNILTLAIGYDNLGGFYEDELVVESLYEYSNRVKPFIVHLSSTSSGGSTIYSANKTNLQIYEAWIDGRNIICTDGDGVWHLAQPPTSTDVLFRGPNWEEQDVIDRIYIGTRNSSLTVDIAKWRTQERLSSGTNIKTINNNSILGSGNLTTSQLGIPSIANNLTTTTTGSTLDATQGKALKDLIDGITVPQAATATPLVDGTADVGSSTKYAKEDHVHPTDTSRVPTTRTINGQALSSDITLTANDVGAATSSDISTAISNLVNSAPTTLDTLNELAAALGDDPNFARTITDQIAAKTIYAGSVAGKLYRNNVGGTGNFTVSGNSGCIPNIPAGTYVVAIYAKSSTLSYTYRFNFGSVTYDLATTNGIINDVRTITLSSAGTFSGVVQVGSVASGSILSVTMYNFHMPINSVGMAAVTNSYNDLNDRPTIPTVNNGTLTIQKNGTNVLTFTANQSSSVTANITVPTTASDVGAVPTTRKVNNKELSSDITLTASDVGALPSNTTIPTVDSSLTGSSQTNPVQGGAIYDVLQDKEDAYITVIELIWDEDVSSPISFKDSNNNTLTHSQVKALFDNPAKNIALWLDSLYTIFKLTEYHGNYNSSSDYYLFYTPPQSGRWELGLDYDGSSFHVDAFGQLLPSPNEIGAVPTSRKINNKALSSDITLTASDVGALPSNTVIPSVVNNLTTTTTGSALDASLGKALKDLIDGITVPSASTTTPVMDGTAAIGSSSEYAKADHVHPSDTSKANVITKTTVSTSGAVSLAMTSGVFYSFTGTPSSLTLTLTAPSTGLGIYAGKFTASSTGCTLSVPASVTESIDNPNIVANGTYEFNIMDNVLLMVQI